MKKEDIEVGREYLYKHGQALVKVRVLRTFETGDSRGRLGPYAGRRISRNLKRWVLLKLSTNREIVAKSAQKFFPIVKSEDKLGITKIELPAKAMDVDVIDLTDISEDSKG